MSGKSAPVPSRLKFDVCVASRSSTPSDALRGSLAVLGGHIHCLHVSARVPLADARMDLIGMVDTKWFLFLDDDALLSGDWLGSLAPFLSRPEMGAVYGVIPERGYGRRVDSAMIGTVRQLAVFPLKPGDRGDTLDTFIRTSAVRDWAPILAVRC